MARDHIESEKARKYMRDAHQLLTHYFRTAFEGANLDWDSDYEDEIAEAVDHIVKAAAAEAEARLGRSRESTSIPTIAEPDKG